MKINLKQFIELINRCEKEIGCTQNENGNVYSHDIEGTLYIIEEGEEDDTCYEIEDIEIDYLLGCRCPCGLTIKIKKEEE